jgi:hypothetical protein
MGRCGSATIPSAEPEGDHCYPADDSAIDHERSTLAGVCTFFSDQQQKRVRSPHRV